MKTILITGGAGFLGSILKKELLNKKYQVVSIDLQKDDFDHPNFTAVIGDIINPKALAKLSQKYTFSAIFHFAAMMPHAVKKRQDFWRTNVDGTKNIADFAKKYHIPRLIFASTNCLWGKATKQAIKEDDPLCPQEIYGKSKMAAETILRKYEKDLKIIIFRCPPIIDESRIGIIGIMFEFVRENRKLWMVGKGHNRYQLVYAGDVTEAMLSALTYPQSNIFNIGSDSVPTFREMYTFIIQESHSKSRLASFPPYIIHPIMRLAATLRISPLSPYAENMLDKNVSLDTTRAKQELNWQPTLNNSEMLLKAYTYFTTHRKELTEGTTNKDLAKMGLIKILKILS
ncbi:MAG: NAD(P)-dependent oxidoreductase [Candidatus Nomurabacteria bacterium]|jgi:nucleoside-diphosphate-sugar epimerase|nr:NAD(P)-dependent oxidoreductase [Candidatus Nomurabacteria bacterium]